jgi:hypothetical protein
MVIKLTKTNKIIMFSIIAVTFLFVIIMIFTPQGLNYSDFSDQHILEVEDQLQMPEDDYYVYYYSTNCGHCSDIKEEVLETFYNVEETVIYFVEGYDFHPDSGVQGTPTLIRVENNQKTELYEGPSGILPMLDTLK